MNKVTLCLLLAFTSTLVSHAESTTSDNLLNNPNFTTDTSGWTLSDNNENKVKRDPATYSGSASKSVRFRYQGGNISQDIDTSSLPENHLIKEINMNFDSIGCGNTGGQWCTAGADDTVVSTITLENATEIQVLSESVAVPYENRGENYSFSKDVTGDFNTDDTSLNLTITGNDTGNSSNWWGPIIDNLDFSVTTEQYVAPIVEPIIEQIVEPVIEQIIEQEITNTIVGGLDLEMSVTNEIILEQPIIEITPISVNITPDINLDMPVEISVDSIDIDTPEQIDVVIEIPVAPVISVDVPDVANLAPIDQIDEIQEIVEIEIPEVVEVEVDVDVSVDSVVEEPAELNSEDTLDQDVAEVSEEKLESSEEVQNESEEETTENEAEATSELSNSDEVEEQSDENKTAAKKKNETKNSTAKTNQPKQKVKKVDGKIEKGSPSAPLSVEQLVQMTLPNAYLQTLQDTLKIVETVSITQDMIYEQNTYDLIGITFESSFGGDSADRFDSLLGRQFSYESGTYRRSR